MKETKRKLYVERDGFCTEASMLFMALAMVFRLIGSIGRWGEMEYLITQVALPIFSGLLFLLCLLLFAKRAFWTTVIPVVIGVVFFIFRIMGVENEWQKVGCIVLYVVVAVLYAMTFSHVNLKWALAALLAGAFLVHVILLDLPVLMDLENPVSFVSGMQEMSVLAIILSLLFISLAMKMPPAPEKAEPVPEQTPVAPEQEPVAPEQEQGFTWSGVSAIQSVAQEDAPAPEIEEPLQEEPVPVREIGFAASPAPAFPEEEPPVDDGAGAP